MTRAFDVNVKLKLCAILLIPHS